MSDTLGLGNIFSSIINGNTARHAQNTQLDALREQRKYVYENLDPNVINPVATAADVTRAKARLALQGQVDPALLQQRYASEAGIGTSLSGLGPGSTSDVLGQQAAGEILASGPATQMAKQKLIDAAMKELDAGATLPSDVQAELVKAGLEKSGMVTQSASGQGAGGQILRTILGTAGINLQMQRQTQAAGLVTQAQNLETARQNILQTLFPRLQASQLNTLGAQQSVLNQSNSLLPNAGLSGTDVANIWLARVGATNSISSQAANVAAQGALAQGAATAQLAGSAGGIGGSIANQLLNRYFNSSTTSGNAGVTPYSNPAGTATDAESAASIADEAAAAYGP